MKLRALLLLILVLLGGLARAEEPELLEPEKAFRFSARLVAPDRLEVRYDIAPGYYMYREKFKFSAEPATVAIDAGGLPPGQVRKDAFFGDVQIYRGTQTFTLPLSVAGERPAAFTLKAVSQGCADLGFCYPRQEHKAHSNSRVRRLPVPASRRRRLSCSLPRPPRRSPRARKTRRSPNSSRAASGAWWRASSASACCSRSRPAFSR